MNDRYTFSKELILRMIATKNTTAVAKKTPYCDTCYRKGLSEKEYTSHYTKSEAGPRGVIVCPTILNSVCNACGGKGHWANEKFCPLMRREAKNKNRVEREHKVSAAVVKPVVKMNQNRFAALLDDEGDAVAPPVSIKTIASTPSWADMAKKPAVLIPKEESSPLTTLKFTDAQSISLNSADRFAGKPNTAFNIDAEREAYKILQERQASGYFDKQNRCSWLDSDSDDEDEEW